MVGDQLTDPLVTRQSCRCCRLVVVVPVMSCLMSEERRRRRDEAVAACSHHTRPAELEQESFSCDPGNGSLIDKIIEPFDSALWMSLCRHRTKRGAAADWYHQYIVAKADVVCLLQG